MIELLTIKNLSPLERDALRTAFDFEKACIGVPVKTGDTPDEEGLGATAIAEGLVDKGLMVYLETDTTTQPDAIIQIFGLTALGKRVARRMVEDDEDVLETLYVRIVRTDNVGLSKWIAVEKFNIGRLEKATTKLDQFLQLSPYIPAGYRPIQLERERPDDFSEI